MPLTHYEILGLKPTATSEEIKRAYRRQALHWHPDKNPNKPKAHRHFIAIRDAYAVLSNSEYRAHYDAVLQERKWRQANPSASPAGGTVSSSHPSAETEPTSQRNADRRRTNRNWSGVYGIFLVWSIIGLVQTCNRQDQTQQSVKSYWRESEARRKHQQHLDSQVRNIERILLQDSIRRKTP